MAEVGVLEVALGVDVAGFLSGMSSAEKAVGVFAAGVAELAKKAIEAASEAQTAAVQLGAIFGPLSEQMKGFAEQLGAASGRAASDIEGMAAKFGGMVDPMVKNRQAAATMTQGLTEMAVAMSKAFHTDNATAVQALESALAGSTRTARQYGIDLSQSAIQQQMLKDGISGTAAEMNSAQRAMVMYQLIMEQMGPMQQRAAAAGATYDEQVKQLDAHMKEAAESFGKDLLPIATSALSVFTNLARAFADLSPQARQAIEALGGAVALLGVSAALTAAFEAFGTAALGAFAEAALAALPLVAAVGGIVLAIGALKLAWDADLGGIKEITASVANFFREAWGKAIGWVTTAINALWEGVRAVFGSLGEFLHSDALKGLSASMGQTTGMGALASAGEAIKSGAQAGAEALKSSWGGFESLLAKFMGMVGGHGAAAAMPAVGTPSLAGIGGGGAATAAAAPSTGGGSKLGLADWMAGVQAMWKQADDAALGIGAVMKTLPKHLEDQVNKFPWGDLFEQFGKTFKGALGQAGSMIQDMIKGASTGGGIGAAMAGIADLLTQSVGFQQAINVISTIFKMLANTLGQIMGPVSTLLGSVQNVLAPILGMLTPILQALLTPLKAIGGFLEVIGQMFQKLEPIFQILTNFLNQIMQIVGNVLDPILQALTPVINVLGIIFQALAPIFQALQLPLELLKLVVQALGPIFQVLGYALQGVAITLGYIVLALAYGWNGIVTAIQDAVNGIITVINAVITAFGAKAMSLLNWSSALIDTNSLQQSLSQLTSSNYDAADSAGSLTSAIDQAAASLTNLPQGYKVAQAEFQNMNTQTASQYAANQGLLNGSGAGAAGALGQLSSSAGQVTNSITQLGQAAQYSAAAWQATVGQQATQSASLIEGGIIARSGGSFHGGSSSTGTTWHGSAGYTGPSHRYASGGVAYTPQTADIAESGGPEAVLPPSLTSLLLRAAGSGGGGAGPSITINATIVSNNPRDIWDKLQTIIKRSAMARRGTALPGVPRYATPSDAR